MISTFIFKCQETATKCWRGMQYGFCSSFEKKQWQLCITYCYHHCIITEACKFGNI